MKSSMELITVSLLEKSYLQVLMEGKIPAIRVEKFVSPEACRSIADRLKQSPNIGQYRNAPLIGRMGQAFFECTASVEDETRYWEHALEWVRELRACCGPGLSPMDKFRLELDEIWPCGATIQTLAGRKMFAGLVRLFGNDAYAEPHQDHLEWDAKACNDTIKLKRQFYANIYLELPEHGGELCIWNRSLSMTEYSSLQIKNSYGLGDVSLTGDSLCIKPYVGDLILFNSRNIHAVLPSHGGKRITWSVFLGYRGLHEPLTIWS